MTDMPSIANPVSVATLIASYCKDVDDRFDELIEKKGDAANAPSYTLFSKAFVMHREASSWLIALMAMDVYLCLMRIAFVVP